MISRLTEGPEPMTPLSNNDDEFFEVPEDSGMIEQSDGSEYKIYEPSKQRDSFLWHGQKSQLSAQEDVIKTGRGIVTTTTDNNDYDVYDDKIELPSNTELGRKAEKPLFRTRTGTATSTL